MKGAIEEMGALEEKMRVTGVDAERSVKEFSSAVAETWVGNGGRRIRRYLEESDPEKAGRILERLAHGESCNKIGESEGLTHTTVLQIRNRHPDFMENEGKVRARAARLAEDSLNALILYKAERVFSSDEEVDKVSIKDLAMAKKMVTEIANSHEGRPNQRVEVRRGPNIADAAEMIEEMKRAAMRDVSVDAEEVEEC